MFPLFFLSGEDLVSRPVEFEQVIFLSFLLVIKDESQGMLKDVRQGRELSISY